MWRQGRGGDTEEKEEARGQDMVSSGQRNACPDVYRCVHGYVRTQRALTLGPQQVRGAGGHAGSEGGSGPGSQAGAWKLSAESAPGSGRGSPEVEQQDGQLETHAMDLVPPSLADQPESGPSWAWGPTTPLTLVPEPPPL